MKFKRRYLLFLFIGLFINSSKAVFALNSTVIATSIPSGRPPSITTSGDNKAIISSIDSSAMPSTIYDADLVKLYSALGALHFLTNICFEKTTLWREKAQNLAHTERLNNLRQKKLFGAFNDSYYGFSTNYRTCTWRALKAYNIFKADAFSLSSRLIAQLGQSND